MKKLLKFDICGLKQIKQRIIELQLPKGTRPKHAFVDNNGSICMYAEVTKLYAATETHCIGLFATGEDIPSPDYNYVATIDVNGKHYHVYYR